jgi:carbonic anhydrase
VLSYGIEILHVKHIIVCGHYHCGGVRAVLDNHELGLIDNWLRPLQELYYCYTDLFQGLTDPEQQVDRLCELNVIQQVYNVCRTTVVQQAWQRGQEVAVHGWIYDLQDGLLRDLNICMTNPDEVVHRYRQAIGVIDQPACAQ